MRFMGEKWKMIFLADISYDGALKTVSLIAFLV